jgi:hypothetical protein
MRPSLPSAALLFAVACAPALPQQQGPSRALVRDVSRVVDARSRIGWLVDEAELQVAVPDALKSACQVEEPTRVATLAWLDGAIAARGGDVTAAWRSRGRDLGAVSELLLLTRTRLVLERAEEWVRAGRCPFWLEPTHRFGGVHTQAGRFFLTIEGGGRGTQEHALGSVKYGGGGSGRLLGGYGLTETWSLALGGEAGGVARFTNLALGQQSDLPDIIGFATIPLVARWQFGLVGFAEIEAGVMGYFDKGRADPTTGQVTAHFDKGLHTGVALGGSYLRLLQGFLPRFAVALTLDYVPAASGRTALTQIGVGARTGVDFARWTRF